MCSMRKILCAFSKVGGMVLMSVSHLPRLADARDGSHHCQRIQKSGIFGSTASGNGFLRSSCS